MAWTFLLTDGTTTLNLADGTTYFVNVGGFQAPPPRRRSAMSGGNLFRHGEDLLAAVYENRTVTMNLQFKGTNATALGTAVTDVWNLLRKAEEFSKDGLGTVVQLRYGWDGAVGTVAFNVIEGALDMGADLHGPHLLLGTRIRNAQLELLCEPFAVGTSESLSNYIADPSFEIAGSALADWTAEADATGTAVRSTARALYGTASMRITLGTTSPVDTQIIRKQSITTTANDIWSIGVRYLVESGQLFKAQMQYLIRDTAGTTVLQQGSATSTATGTSTWSEFSLTNISATASAGTLEYRLIMTSRNVSLCTGTAFYYGAEAYLATALPVAWVSGRDVRNHFDDNGQAHINYFDAYDIPGDVTALLQVKAAEKEAHTQFWIGARNDRRLGNPSVFLEAESFSTSSGSGTWTGTTVAALSGGSGITGPGGGSFSNTAGVPNVIVFNIATPPQGLYRALVRMAKTDITAKAYVGVGYSYGSITQTPSATSQYVSLGTSTALTITDVGALTIPPTVTPEGGTVGTFSVRLAMYGDNQSIQGTVDYLMLMPADQGFGYGTKASSTNVVWADSRSKPPSLYVMSTADVVAGAFNSQVGSPPEGHPKGTRFYLLGGSAVGSVADGWNTTLVYVPRWLNVR